MEILKFFKTKIFIGEKSYFFKKLEKVIFCLLVFFLIFPIIFLCFFSHPEADDFWYAKSFLQIGTIKSFFNTYFMWTGRFTVNFLNQSFFNPLTYKNFEFYYKFFTFINLIFFIFSFFLIFFKLNKYFLFLDKKKLFLFTFCIFISFCSGMPSLAEGFYWFSAYIQYIFPLSILFFCISLWIDFIKNHSETNFLKITNQKIKKSKNILIYDFSSSLKKLNNSNQIKISEKFNEETKTIENTKKMENLTKLEKIKKIENIQTFKKTKTEKNSNAVINFSENLKSLNILILPKIFYLLILMFLLLSSFLLSGFYEPFSIMLIFINLVYFIFAYKSKSSNKNIIFSFLVLSILGFLVMYLAPGNRVRIGFFDNRNHFFIMLFNLLRDFFSIFKWFFNINILLFIVLYIFFDIKIKFSSKFLRNSIYFFSLLIILFYFSMIYATGGVPPARLENIIYLFFIILINLVINFLFNKYLDIEILKFFDKLKKFRFLFLFFIFCNMILINGNIKTIYDDIFSGKIFVYNMELQNIYKKIQNSLEKTIALKDLTFYPKSIALPFRDIKLDLEDFFDKKIILENINMNRINEYNLDQNIRNVIKNFLKSKK